MNYKILLSIHPVLHDIIVGLLILWFVWDKAVKCVNDTQVNDKIRLLISLYTVYTRNLKKHRLFLSAVIDRCHMFCTSASERIRFAHCHRSLVGPVRRLGSVIRFVHPKKEWRKLDRAESKQSLGGNKFKQLIYQC